MDRIKRIFNKIIELVKKPVMRILPGNLAFFLVLSIIPIVGLVGYFASFFGISITALINFINETLPKEITEILLPFIGGSGIDTNVIVFMILGFLLASNGANSIIIASNTLYGSNSSGYIKRRIKAFFMTIILILLFFLILFLLGFGTLILNTILTLELLSFISKELIFVFSLLKWPIAFILVFFLIKVLYTMANDKRIPSRYMNKGALFTTTSFIIVTGIYSFYVQNFVNYDLFYGSLSNIIILMMWIYILSYILILGIAINASCYEIPEEVSSIEIDK